MKKIILFIAILIFAGCAKMSQTPVGEEGAARIWDKMQTASADATGPYRLQLSMRFGEEGDTRRVTALLWGNGDNALRLDVMAGVGAVIAKIAEAGDNFLAFMPRENKAYFHEGSNRPLLKVGVPVPFDLMQLADILNGRFTQVFGGEAESSEMLKNGDASYALTGLMAGQLVLNPEGSPVGWRQQSGGWELSLAYDEESPFLPKSLRLQNVNGKFALILVKERESMTEPFAGEQLKLNVPDGTPMLPLSQFKTR